MSLIRDLKYGRNELICKTETDPQRQKPDPGLLEEKGGKRRGKPGGGASQGAGKPGAGRTRGRGEPGAGLSRTHS